MTPTGTHQNQTGEKSADRAHGSRRGPDDARQEQASKDADVGVAPEQAGTPPDTANSQAKRSRSIEKE